MKAYEDYRKRLILAGVSQSDADLAVLKMAKEDKLLDALICPDCGEPVSKNKDPRQVGKSSSNGTWFKFRCSCGFILDRLE